MTGYRAGSSSACAADADHWHLFQRSVFACARDGLLAEEILRLYLDPRLQMVEPGQGDAQGDAHGDLALLVRSKGTARARVYSGTGSAFSAAMDGPTVDPRPAAAASADITGDGLADLVLIARRSEGWELQVTRSTGQGYGPAETWRSEPGETLPPDARLLVGDFGGDGRLDVGVLTAGYDAGYGNDDRLPQRQGFLRRRSRLVGGCV